MANTIHSIFAMSIVLSVLFFRNSISITSKCSTRSSSIYCLDSGLPSTWYNNNSVIMNGWQMRVFLVNRDNQKANFYCGFYCNGSCDSFLFSVVAVGGDIVWIANRDRPVKINASVELTRRGLLLRDSDGSEVWSSNISTNSIVGMNLNQTGNLALFNNGSTTLWEAAISFNASKSSTNTSVVFPQLPPQPSPAQRRKPELAPNPSLPEQPTPPPERHPVSLAAIISGSVGGASVIIGLLIILIFRMISQRRKKEEDAEDYIKQLPGMLVSFSYQDLRLATEDFKLRLGGGGFGSVFKGVLADGTAIAVKRLDRLGQGKREFLAEVETIGSLHHFNLVRLIGYCAEKSCRLLVYEYMSHGSLDKWIFHKDERPCLDWQTRKKIILDIAKGLAYLHEDCRQTIIHLDIKPQNILLDQNFNAKVSDFGLSKLIDRDESQVLTTMRGTPGYLAPEWRQLRITVKVDIYSFGIVLLEVVCARRNVDRSQSESTLNLLQLLQKKAEEDRLIEIVANLDEEMLNCRDEVIRMIKIGAWCLQDDPKRRPLMSTVVKVLEGVMEVDSKIIYKFSHALTTTSPVVDDRSSSAPPPSVLSYPR